MGNLKDKIGEKWNARVNEKKKVTCDFCEKKMPSAVYVEKLYGHSICKDCMKRIHLEARLETDEEVQKQDKKIDQYGKMILAAGAILVLLLSLLRKVIEVGTGDALFLLCLGGIVLMLVFFALFVALRKLCQQRMVDLLNNKE